LRIRHQEKDWPLQLDAVLERPQVLLVVLQHL
jgi:hypothetical protein